MITDQLAGRLVEAFLPEATQAKLRSDAAFSVARNLLACRTKFIDDLLVDWYAQLKARSSAEAVAAQVLQNEIILPLINYVFIISHKLCIQCSLDEY